MEYSFDINLQQRSIIAYCLSLWNRPDIKRKTSLFFHKKKVKGITGKKEERWAAITREVMKKVDNLTLPHSVILDIRNVIKSLGLKLYNWVGYVTKNLKFSVKNALQICWTPYGTIDQGLVLKKYWMDNPKVMHENEISWFYVLCGTGLPRGNKLAIEILKDLEVDEFRLRDMKLRRRDRLFESTLLHLIPNSLLAAVTILLMNHSIEVNLFRLCLLEGLYNGAVTYWHQMSKSEQKRNYQFAIQRTIGCWFNRKCEPKSIRRYTEERYVEILVFLMSQMSENLLECVLEKRGEDILHLLASTWPWQSMFVVTFEKILKLNKKINYEWIIKSLTAHIRNEHEFGFDIDRSIHQRLLRYVWGKIPNCEKGNTIVRKYCFIVADLLRAFDVESLQMIYFDENIRPKVKLVNEYNIGCFETWVEKGKYEWLDRFMNEVLISEDERNHFISLFNFYDAFIKKGLLDEIDKYLEWRNISKEEFKRKNIDAMDYCKHFITSENYDAASKFLNWYFVNEEELERFKDGLKDESFICLELYKHWSKEKELTFEDFLDKKSNHVEISKDKSSKLLNWLFMSNEDMIIFFKKNILLKDQECAKTFLRTLSNNGISDFDVFTQFLDFCLVSEEKLMELKENFLKEINDLLKLVLCTARDLNLANELLDWLIQDESEKTKIIQGFMTKANAIPICHKIFDNYHDERKILNFLNIWIKPSKDIAEIKNEWKKISEEKFLPPFPSKFISAFEKLESGYDVVPGDVLGLDFVYSTDYFNRDYFNNDEDSEDEDNTSNDNEGMTETEEESGKGELTEKKNKDENEEVDEDVENKTGSDTDSEDDEESSGEDGEESSGEDDEESSGEDDEKSSGEDDEESSDEDDVME